MSYATATLLKDANGLPIPQYYNATTDIYEPIEGSGGDMFVAGDSQAIPVGGAIGQVLAKASTTDKDLTWLTIINFKGTWSSSTNYAVNDIVALNGSSYVCIDANMNQSPPNVTYWVVLAQGASTIINYKGTWNSATAYVVNDITTFNGSSYICILANTNYSPPNATYWAVFAQAGTSITYPINAAGAINDALVTMASASTMNIGAAAGNYIIITGTTNITAFDSPQAGTMRWLRFSGTLAITYNASTMILPGGGNITVHSGDAMLFVSDGSGIWRCVAYQPGNYSMQTLFNQSNFLGAGLSGTDNEVSFSVKYLRNMTFTNMHFIFTTAPTAAITVLVFQNGTQIASKSMSGNYIWTGANITVTNGDIFYWQVSGSANGFVKLTCEPEAVDR